MNKNKNYTPNPKLHRYFSVIKSTIRMFGYALLLIDIPSACFALIISELLGVVEEYV